MSCQPTVYYLDHFVGRRGAVDDRVGGVPGQHGAQPVGAPGHRHEHERAVRVLVLLHDAQGLLRGLVCWRHAEIHVEAEFSGRCTDGNSLVELALARFDLLMNLVVLYLIMLHHVSSQHRSNLMFLNLLSYLKQVSLEGNRIFPLGFWSQPNAEVPPPPWITFCMIELHYPGLFSAACMASTTFLNHSFFGKVHIQQQSLPLAIFWLCSWSAGEPMNTITLCCTFGFRKSSWSFTQPKLRFTVSKSAAVTVVRFLYTWEDIDLDKLRPSS